MFTLSTNPGALLVLSATVLLGACATPVKSTIDSAANIGTYKTYAWVSEEPYIETSVARPELVNPLNHQRIRHQVEAALDSKGYVRTSADEADIVLGVTLGARDRLRVREHYNAFGYRYFGFNRFGTFNRFGRHNTFGPGFGRPFATTRVQRISEGTLAIDIFDNQTKQAIWHGSATRSLRGDATGEALIADAVEALIAPLPASGRVSAHLEVSNESAAPTS